MADARFFGTVLLSCRWFLLNLREMVTVIITAYNVEKWLQRAIDSVTGQTFHDWRLLIVDDGSTDGTAAIADNAAGLDMRVSVIHTANNGAAHARATGVAEARTELVTFVDADDTLEPTALQWLMSYVSSDVSVIVGGIRRYTDKGSYAVRGAFSGVMTNAEFINGLLMDDFTPSLCGKLFHRQDLLGLDGILDKEIVLNEDLLMLIAALRPPGVLYIDTSELIYNYSYRHGSATSSATMSFRGWQKLINGLDEYVEDNETFFLYRLRRLYDCCITRGAMFSRFHPEIKRLMADSKKYKLESQDKRIIMMLYSRQLRRIVARRHRRIIPQSGVVISVVLPAFNEPRLIERAIRSIVNQSFRDWELVVVDDCSTDTTPEVVRAMAAVDSRIRLIRSSSNLGQGAARLQGVAAARGDYVAFIDQDDVMAPEALARMWSCVQRNEADIVVMGSCRLSKSGWFRLPLFSPAKFFKKPVYATHELLPHLLLRDGFPCTQWDKLYRRGFIDLADHQRETVGEDLLFNLRVMLHEGHVAWVDYQGYRWRAGGQSEMAYPQRWSANLDIYRRVLEVLKAEGLSDDRCLRENLDRGLINDFLDKIACGLRQEWRKGLTRFVESALESPELTDAMGKAGLTADVDSSIAQGRKWRGDHRKYYAAMSLIKRF